MNASFLQNLGGVLVVVMLSFGLSSFPWWMSFLQMLLGALLWWQLFEDYKASQKTEKTFSFFKTLFWVLVTVFIASRLYPFFLAEHPLGYDTGIYRFEIAHIWETGMAESFGLFLGLPFLIQMFEPFGISVDAFLYGFLLLGVIVAPLFFYLALKKIWGSNIALIAMALFVFSVVQWQLFSMVLLKQVLALPLVFACWWMLEKRSYLVLVLLFLIALLQPLDAFLLGLGIVVMGFYSWFKNQDSKRYYALLCLMGSVVVTGLFLVNSAFWNQAWQIFSSGFLNPSQLEVSLQSGVFIDLSQFAYQASLVLIFAVIGWVWTLLKKQVTYLHFYFLVIGAWIILQFFFYQRLLIQFDAVMIAFAAVPIALILESKDHKPLLRALVAVLSIGVVGSWGAHLMQYKPDLQDQELYAITSYCSQLTKESVIVATDSYYGPWLKGFCPQNIIVAPGIFNNLWSREDWEVFWEGEDLDHIQKLLRMYSGELYFFVGDQQLKVPFSHELFSSQNENWWKALRD